MAITPWKITNSRYLIRDPWMTLRADRCETASGVVLDPYYLLEPQDWVQIVAFDREDRLLIIRQYRHGAGLISAELPCGAIEPGETPDQAARRELLEETGCISDALERLPVLPPTLRSTPIRSTPLSRRVRDQFKSKLSARLRRSSSNS